MHELEIAHVY